MNLDLSVFGSRYEDIVKGYCNGTDTRYEDEIESFLRDYIRTARLCGKHLFNIDEGLEEKIFSRMLDVKRLSGTELRSLRNILVVAPLFKFLANIYPNLSELGSICLDELFTYMRDNVHTEFSIIRSRGLFENDELIKASKYFYKLTATNMRRSIGVKVSCICLIKHFNDYLNIVYPRSGRLMNKRGITRERFVCQIGSSFFVEFSPLERRNIYLDVEDLQKIQYIETRLARRDMSYRSLTELRLYVVSALLRICSKYRCSILVKGIHRLSLDNHLYNRFSLQKLR